MHGTELVKRCPSCNGTGLYREHRTGIGVKCQKCGGTGWVQNVRIGFPLGHEEVRSYERKAERKKQLA